MRTWRRSSWAEPRHTRQCQVTCGLLNVTIVFRWTMTVCTVDASAEAARVQRVGHLWDLVSLVSCSVYYQLCQMRHWLARLLRLFSRRLYHPALITATVSCTTFQAAQSNVYRLQCVMSLVQWGVSTSVLFSGNYTSCHFTSISLKFNLAVIVWKSLHSLALQ